MTETSGCCSVRPDSVRALRVAEKLAERHRDVNVNGAVTQLWELASPA